MSLYEHEPEPEEKADKDWVLYSVMVFCGLGLLLEHFSPGIIEQAFNQAIGWVLK